MTTYNIYVGAKFEVRNGVPFSVYEVLVVTNTHVTYTDLISQMPRTVTTQTFIKFLQDANAVQVA